MSVLQDERQASALDPAMRLVVSIDVVDAEDNRCTVKVEVGRGNFLAYSGDGNDRRTFADVYQALDHAAMTARDILEYYDAHGLLPAPGETT